MFSSFSLTLRMFAVSKIRKDYGKSQGRLETGDEGRNLTAVFKHSGPLACVGKIHPGSLIWFVPCAIEVLNY